MNETEFERQLDQWLRHGPSSASPHVLRAVTQHARGQHPIGGLRSMWNGFAEWVSIHRPAPIALRPMVLGLLLAIAFALGVSAYGAWERFRVVTPAPSPTATPPAQTGAFDCPAGTDPNMPGPANQSRPHASGYQEVAVDRQAGILVMPSSMGLWRFDLCTNTWRKSAVSTGTTGVPVYDADSDVTVIFGQVGLKVYDAHADTIRDVEGVPLGSRPTGALYDPETGLIFVTDNSMAMWTYDVDTNTWRKVEQRGEVPRASGARLMAYDSSVKRIIMYRGIGLGAAAETYEFDPVSSTWIRTDTFSPPMIFVWGDLVRGGEIAYDEAHQRTIVFSRGRAIAYDASADAWEVVFDSDMEADPPVANEPTHRQAASLAYDPLNRRTLAIGGDRRVETWPYYWIGADDVIAFDLGNRFWTELLPPTAEIPPWQPAPPMPFACPAGTDPDRPGPVDQQRPDFSAQLAFDRRAGLVVTVAGDPSTLWTFDVCTNVWRRSAAILPAAGFWFRSPIAYDELNDRVVLFGDRVVTYDTDADSISVGGEVPAGPDGHAVYRTMTGRFVVRDDGASRLWSYDPSSDAWDELAQGGDVPIGPALGAGAALLAYDRTFDILVLYTRVGDQASEYRYDFRTSAWTRNPVDPPAVGLSFVDLGRWQIAYDESHLRTVVFGSDEVMAYDASARDWQSVFRRRAVLPTAAVYDPVNGRILTDGGPDGADLAAFNLETNTWTVLLEAIP